MDFPAEHEKNVFGQFDEYVKKNRAGIKCYDYFKRWKIKDFRK